MPSSEKPEWQKNLADRSIFNKNCIAYQKIVSWRWPAISLSTFYRCYDESSGSIASRWSIQICRLHIIYVDLLCSELVTLSLAWFTVGRIFCARIESSCGVALKKIWCFTTNLRSIRPQICDSDLTGTVSKARAPRLTDYWFIF